MAAQGWKEIRSGFYIQMGSAEEAAAGTVTDISPVGGWRGLRIEIQIYCRSCKKYRLVTLNPNQPLFQYQCPNCPQRRAVVNFVGIRPDHVYLRAHFGGEGVRAYDFVIRTQGVAVSPEAKVRGFWRVGIVHGQEIPEARLDRLFKSVNHGLKIQKVNGFFRRDPNQ